MNIFIPAPKDENPFFEGIIAHSKSNFIFSTIEGYNEEPIVLIHWPEQLFNWREPTIEELNVLKSKILSWKKKSKIVYLVHNLERHYGMTDNFLQLYSCILDNSDVMVHMGDFSLKKMKPKYPKSKHIRINHSLYDVNDNISRLDARQLLNFTKEVSKIVVVPCKILSNREYKMVLNAFNSVKSKNDLLIFSNVNSASNISYKGKTRLKKIRLEKYVSKWLYKKMYPKQKDVICHYGFMPSSQLSVYLCASDVVFVPRIEILNSGSLFLGLSYNKVTIGPDKGNLSEVLDQFNLPKFNPINEDSVSDALKRALNVSSFKLNKKALEAYSPESLANQWDNMFLRLIKSSI